MDEPDADRRARTEGDPDLGLAPLHLRPLLRIEVTVTDAVEISPQRRYVPLTGGRFVGRDGLRGIVLPGGSDWQRIRPDETIEIEAHYALRADDGRCVEVHSTGLRRAYRPAPADLAPGEQVRHDSHYFRTHIRLSTAEPSLSHLNEVIAVSTGRRDPQLVHIHVHEVL